MRSSRSPCGVPAASASGARSRCGVQDDNVIARTLGDKSDGMETQNPPRVLVTLTMADLDINRNATFLQGLTAEARGAFYKP